jgi:hypothetical protein
MVHDIIAIWCEYCFPFTFWYDNIIPLQDFFFIFLCIEILVKFDQKIAKIVEFTLEKQNFPKWKFSQFLCQKMAKFRQK